MVYKIKQNIKQYLLYSIKYSNNNLEVSICKDILKYLEGNTIIDFLEYTNKTTKEVNNSLLQYSNKYIN